MSVRILFTEIAKDWLGLALVGLGVTFAAHLYIGGLFFALAAASFARVVLPEEKPLELWCTLGIAWLTSTLAAIAAHWYWPDVGPPVVPQLVMAITGFFSRHMTRAALRMAGRVEGTSDNVVDRIMDWLLPRRR
jgi:hypothetical protein